MPILKKSNAVTYLPFQLADGSGFQINFLQQYANNYNTLLAEDESQSVLYIDGQAYEATSLVPFFEKKPLALNPNRTNTFTMYESNTLITKYNFANASLTTTPNTVTNGNSTFQSENNVGLSTLGKVANLTGVVVPGGTTANVSLLTEVTIQGVKYTFYLTKHYPDDDGSTSWYDLSRQKLVMIQGNSLENPTAIAEYTFPVDGAVVVSAAFLPTYTLLYIDTANKYIYFLDNPRKDFSSIGEYSTQLIALKFNTASEGGIGFPSNPVNIINMRSGSFTAQNNSEFRTPTRNIQGSILSFCGLDTFNNLIFLEQYNKSISYPRTPNTYQLRFHVVKYSSGSPSVTRTVDLVSTGQWTIGSTPSSWAPGNTPSMLSYPTNFIADSITSTTKRCLLVLPQQTYQVAPIVITWNSALDASSTSTTPFSMAPVAQANLIYPAGTTSLDYIDIRYDNVVTSTSSSAQTIYGFQKAIVSTLAGSTYITFFTSWKYQVNMDLARSLSSKKMNAICYKLTNLETAPVLEYVQSFPIEALDYFLTDSDTTLNVLDNDGISFYSLTPSGWVSTSKEAGVFTSIALDSFGRFWASKIAGKNYLNWSQPYSLFTRPFYNPDLELHIIPRTTAFTTSVSFANIDQEYNGVNINNTLLVNAYNSAGQRIETSVLLSIEGANMVFEGGGTQITLTTSPSLNTSVPVVITGPGYVNVTASFVI